MLKDRADDYHEDTIKAIPKPEPDVDVRCGYGDCKPPFLQKLNTPKMLLAVLCLFSLTHGFIVNGINNVNTQSIERRFGLSSANVALISSAQDFAAGVSAVFLAFVGSGPYKARLLAAGSFCAAIGSAIMVLPHFTTDLYDWGQYSFIPMCIPNSTISEDCEASGLDNYLWVFIGGMCLMGIASTIQYTVGIGFLDDSVPANSSPLYIGILYSISVLGPGIGYIAGGQFLAKYVDFDKVDTDTLGLKLRDPRWVGAWWPPFFISMALFFISGVVLACYGAELPTAKGIRNTRESQTHTKKSDKEVVGSRDGRRPQIKLLPKMTLALLRNAPFVLVMLSGVPTSLTIFGLATFLPKLIQNKFNKDALTAALMSGAIAVPGGAGGMLFGGFICSRMQLKVRGMMKLSIIASVISLGATASLLIGCDRVPMAGITSPYQDGGVVDNDVFHSCNNHCSCSTRYYHPVCTEDGFQYFTACHAGCITPAPETKSYHNCTCTHLTQETTGTSVRSGECETDCNSIYLFGILFFVSAFSIFVVTPPGDAIMLRCIEEEHRTFSMGIKGLFGRFLGTVPGPIIYGVMTDRSCTVWKTICGEDTSCWIYDIEKVSRNFFFAACSTKLISIISIALALFIYKPPPMDVEIKKTSENENEIVTEGIINEGVDITHM